MPLGAGRGLPHGRRDQGNRPARVRGRYAAALRTALSGWIGRGGGAAMAGADLCRVPVGRLCGARSGAVARNPLASAFRLLPSTLERTRLCLLRIPHAASTHGLVVAAGTKCPAPLVCRPHGLALI